MKRHAMLLAFLSCLAGAVQAGTVPDNVFSVPLEAWQADADKASLKLYKAEGADLTAYHAVLLEPLYFMRHDASGRWSLLESGEENRIAAHYQAAMRAALARAGVAVAEEPGPGVARLRVAVTGLAQTRPGVDVVDLLPIKAVFNLGRLAAGKEPYLVKLGSMAQLEDARSGRLLAGAVNLRKSDKTVTKDAPVTLDAVRSLLDEASRDGARLLAGALTSAPAAN